MLGGLRPPEPCHFTALVPGPRSLHTHTEAEHVGTSRGLACPCQSGRSLRDAGLEWKSSPSPTRWDTGDIGGSTPRNGGKTYFRKAAKTNPDAPARPRPPAALPASRSSGLTEGTGPQPRSRSHRAPRTAHLHPTRPSIGPGPAGRPRLARPRGLTGVRHPGQPRQRTTSPSRPRAARPGEHPRLPPRCVMGAVVPLAPRSQSRCVTGSVVLR